MLHNVLTRQLPFEPARVDAALADGRHRAATAGRRPLAVGEWLALRRGARRRSAPRTSARSPVT